MYGSARVYHFIYRENYVLALAGKRRRGNFFNWSRFNITHAGADWRLAAALIYYAGANFAISRAIHLLLIMRGKWCFFSNLFEAPTAMFVCVSTRPASRSSITHLRAASATAKIAARLLIHNWACSASVPLGLAHRPMHKLESFGRNQSPKGRIKDPIAAVHLCSFAFLSDRCSNFTLAIIECDRILRRNVPLRREMRSLLCKLHNSWHAWVLKSLLNMI